MSLGNILIRADASVSMGTGHVMRCLALAQAWQDAGGKVVFAMAESLPSISERLRAEGIPVARLNHSAGSDHDARETLELAGSNRADWLVIDGYAFDAEYQRRMKNAGMRLLVVDDGGDVSHYSADLVLNQNVHSNRAMYEKRESYTRLLLGPRYALLRREFGCLRGQVREVTGPARKVLITMGGSDAANVTSKVIRALGLVGMEGLQSMVLVGGGNPHMDVLRELAAGCGAEIRIVSNPQSVGELMLWADVAVSAAGSTCWEMCFLGLPAMVIDVAENQRLIAEGLARLAIFIHAGSSESVSEEKMAADIEGLLLSQECRSAMSRRGRELVDGEGARRMVGELQRSRGL